MKDYRFRYYSALSREKHGRKYSEEEKKNIRIMILGFIAIIGVGMSFGIVVLKIVFK